MSVFRIRLFQFVLFECRIVAESICHSIGLRFICFGDYTGIRLGEKYAREWRAKCEWFAPAGTELEQILHNFMHIIILCTGK